LTRRHGSAPEFASCHRRESSAHSPVPEGLIDIGEAAPTATEWCESIMKIVPVEAIHTEGVVSVAPAAIPRVIPVARPAGHPSDAAKASPVIAKSKAAAESPSASSKSEEGDIRRCPDRIISRVVIYRAGPPRPVSSIDEPTPIVIRCPSPRLIGHPCPAVVWFPDPAAVTIRRPSRVCSRSPHLAIIRNFRPGSIGVQIFRACVVAVCMPPTLRACDHPVAIVVPCIPIIFARRGVGLIFRIVRSGDGDHLSLFNVGGTLRRRDFRGAIPHNHLRLCVGVHQDAVIALAGRMNRRVGRVNFGICLAALEDRIFCEALSYLHLNVCASQVGHGCGRIVRHAQNIRVIKLKLGAGFLARGHPVARHNGRIQGSGHPLAVVAALGRDIAVDKAQPRRARLVLRRLLGLRILLLCLFL